MATFVEESVYCEECGRSTLARSRSVNHILHLLLSVLMCGWWLIVWAFISLTWFPCWRCSRCGSICDGPSNIVGRMIGLIALVAFLVPVAGCAGLLIYGLPSSTRTASVNTSDTTQPAATAPTSVQATIASTHSTPLSAIPTQSATNVPPVPLPSPSTPSAQPPTLTFPTPPTSPPSPSPTRPTTPSPPSPPKNTPPPILHTHVVTPPKLGTVPMATNKIKLDAYLEAELLDPAKAKQMIADAEVFLATEPLKVNVEGDPYKGTHFCRPTEGPAKGKLLVVEEKYVTPIAKR